MMAQDVHPDSPSLLTKAVKAKQDFPGRFAQRQLEVAEGYGAAAQNLLAEIAPGMGAGPVKTEALGTVVTNAAKAVDRAEGKEIGALKAKAMATLKNERVPVPPEIQQQSAQLMKEFGFKMRPNADGKTFAIIPPKDLRSLVGKNGLTSLGEVRTFVNNLNDFAQSSKSGMRITDLERFRGVLGEAGDALWGTSAGANLSQMATGVRKLYRSTIERGLENETERKLFSASMDKYSLIREGSEQLKRVLRDDVTSKTMVQSFFKGKENLANIRAIKAIAGGEESAAWGSLRDEFVNQLMIKHGDRSSKTGLKSGAFLYDLRKNYGDDFIREVIPPKQMQKLTNLLTVGERIEAQI
jgi:hypothetical protein